MQSCLPPAPGHRPASTAGLLATLVLTLLAASVPLVPRPAHGQGSPRVSNEAVLEERVARAMRATYFHGVDDALAAEVLGRDAVPVLRRLLFDPSFPRRDNVVAFLGHLGDDAGTSADLLAFLASPPAPLRRPEEARAMVLAPLALGHVASRREALALDALLGATAEGSDASLVLAGLRGEEGGERLLEPVVEMALLGLAHSQVPLAHDRLTALADGRVRLGLAQDLRPAAARALQLWAYLQAPPSQPDPGVLASAPLPAGPGAAGMAALAAGGMGSGPGPQDPSGWDAVDAGAAGCLLGGRRGVPPGGDPSRETQSFDLQSREHDTGLTYANHVELESFDRMDDARLDVILDEISFRIGREDFATDVACCVTLSRSGTAGTWGSVGGIL